MIYLPSSKDNILSKTTDSRIRPQLALLRDADTDQSRHPFGKSRSCLETRHAGTSSSTEQDCSRDRYQPLSI